MNEEQAIELGRRAVACKGWRWMPGMLALDSTDEEHPGRVIDDRKSLVYEDADGAIREGVVSRSDLPDLRDPATLGCLLALVREAWGKPLLYVEPEEDEIDGLAWYVWDAGEARSYSRGLHRSEAAALVAALEDM